MTTKAMAAVAAVVVAVWVLGAAGTAGGSWWRPAGREVAEQVGKRLGARKAAAPAARRLAPGVGRAAESGRLALTRQFGPEAAQVLRRHPGVAAPLLQAHGAAAGQALASLSRQNGRRLAILLQEWAGKAPEQIAKLLAVIARYGDRALEFVWKRKGALAVSAVMALFLADPQPFLDGTRQLGETTVKAVAKAVSDAAGQAVGQPATEGARALAESAGGQAALFGVGAAGFLWLGWVAWLRHRRLTARHKEKREGAP
jgi:hypothetical protein